MFYFRLTLSEVFLNMTAEFILFAADRLPVITGWQYLIHEETFHAEN